MNKLIKKLLRKSLLNEEMKSVLDGSFQTKENYHNLMIVAKDNYNPLQHYLVLSVNLVSINNFYELSYGFSIHNSSFKQISQYMYSRNEVAKYLPLDLKNKITPEVLKMTKDLINKNKPNNIYMETYESNMDGDSVKRFENLTQFVINVCGYKLKEGYPRKNNDNKLEWIFINENGKEDLMTEEMLLEYSSENRWKRLSERMNKVLTPENIKSLLK